MTRLAGGSIPTAMSATNTHTSPPEVRLTLKECARCHKKKIAEADFYSNSSTKDGLNKSCKPCVKDYLRERRREKKRALDRDRAAELGITPERYSIIVAKIVSLLTARGVHFDRAVDAARAITDEVVTPIAKL